MASRVNPYRPDNECIRYCIYILTEHLISLNRSPPCLQRYLRYFDYSITTIKHVHPPENACSLNDLCTYRRELHLGCVAVFQLTNSD